jgi:hypothetical protein
MPGWRQSTAKEGMWGDGGGILGARGLGLSHGSLSAVWKP